MGLIIPDEGEAYIDGYNMSSPKQALHGRQSVGAVLEGSRNVYWRLSVIENLRYFGRLRGLSFTKINQRSEHLLSLLSLQEQRDKEVRFLSRGMQQKVSIANALLHEPQLLVLDEPTLGLDVEAAQTLEATIVDFVAEGGAVILTTHVMSLAERLAHRIFVIHQGEKVAYEETQRLLARFNTQNLVEIKLKRELSPAVWAQLSSQFSTLVYTADTHLIEWPKPSQSDILALYQTLNQAGYDVLSINQREPALEEVFLSLTQS